MIIKERRSIRKFKPEMPEKKDIEQTIEAGLYAPSARGSQSPIIVTEKELRDKISADNCKIGGWDKTFDPFYGAPVIFLAPKNWANRVYGLVTGNLIILSAWAAYGFTEQVEMPEYKKLLTELGLEGEWEGIGHCAIGVIDGEIPKAAERKKGRVFWVE